jgi:hypothetical protein
MNQCRTAALLAALLLAATFANAAAKGVIRIKILDAKTETITTGDNGAPRNCDLSNYDAYCHGSTEGAIVNVLLVQEGNGAPFTVRCANDSKWVKSRCIALTKGETFDAAKEKHGLSIFYVDDEGKTRKQLYTYVTRDEKGNPIAPPDSRETQASPAPVENAESASAAAPAVAVTPAADVTAAPAANGPRVKCSFSSTPSGADITLDGQYVGSTPSTLDVSSGKHNVVFTMPGFSQWKRQLTVSTGSELTVNAVLQKAQ